MQPPPWHPPGDGREMPSGNRAVSFDTIVLCGNLSYQQSDSFGISMLSFSVSSSSATGTLRHYLRQGRSLSHQAEPASWVASRYPDQIQRDHRSVWKSGLYQIQYLANRPQVRTERYMQGEHGGMECRGNHPEQSHDFHSGTPYFTACNVHTSAFTDNYNHSFFPLHHY